MFFELIEDFKLAIQSRKLNRIPAVKLGRELIGHFWVKSKVQPFSEEFVKSQSEKMMEAVVEIATSADPRMANRGKLTNCVLETARLQVLVIGPPPAEDPTMLRGQPGITGELRAKLVQLSKTDKNLKELLHGFNPKPTESNEIFDSIFFRYLVCVAWTNLFHGLRYEFGDCNKEGNDWYRPFMTAMCGWEESRYREHLGMAPALDGRSNISPSMKALMLSLFFDCVLDGSRFPDLEWSERIADIEKGDRSWRDGSWLDI